ncbi:MAG: metal ABC transporter permease [Anaerolineales bacterium]|nr:metal ABC transporter permease [Anaerolineales bacterium]MCB8961193.1 metal ABC transporter permease [Ardenticatenales bacterium]
MDWGQLLYDLFFDYTLRTVALGTAIVGIVGGVLGSYALLRKQSLLGDAISHAALPGVIIAFMITRSRASIVLMIGALIAGILATQVVLVVVRNTRIKEDSALGIALSVFFGLGLMLLTLTQRMVDARQAGLDRFLFGQAATLVQADVITMAIIGVLAIALVALFWKEFKLISFDAEFAASMGFPARALEVMLTTLLVVAIVVGLQAVGVILMSAMVVAPAAGARQWTNRFGLMVLLAALFGGLSGVIGAVISSTGAGLSTGPVIVLVISCITILSMLMAPNRGLIWNWWRQVRQRQQLRVETIMLDLWALSGQHEALDYGHSLEAIHAMNPGRRGEARTLAALEDRGWVQRAENGFWALTPAGAQQAQYILQQTNHAQSALTHSLQNKVKVA